MRSLLITAAAGAADPGCSAITAPGLPAAYEESIDHPPPPISREAEIAAAVGVVFGLPIG